MKTMNIFLFVLLLAAGAGAQTRDGSVFVSPMAEIGRIAKHPAALEDDRSTIESWYLFFSFGAGHSAYPPPLRYALYAAASGGRRDQYVADAGAYLPLRDRRTIVGLAVSVVTDLYNKGDMFFIDSAEVQINHVFAGPSAMRFLFDDIGRGPFVRADAGLARFRMRTERSPDITRTGIGFLLGTGYSLPLTDGERLVLSVTYAGRHVGGEDYGTFGVTLGLLL